LTFCLSNLFQANRKSRFDLPNARIEVNFVNHTFHVGVDQA